MTSLTSIKALARKDSKFLPITAWRKTMRHLLYAIALGTILGVPSAAVAGIGNEKGVDSGKKTGWTSIDHHGHEMAVPKGLAVSGKNGRVDNGTGNGGEHPGHHTPSHHGENGMHDEDPN